MRCTVKKTLQIARESGHDVLVQVKGNQQALSQTLKTFIEENSHHDEAIESDISRRNRHEQRQCRTWAVPDDLFPPDSGWHGIKTIIEVNRRIQVFSAKTQQWSPTHECSLSICTRSLSAKDCADATRQHWAIENRLHHVRDVTLREDASRIRRRPAIMACLRSWALNILRANGENNISQALFANAINPSRLQQYKGLL